MRMPGILLAACTACLTPVVAWADPIEARIDEVMKTYVDQGRFQGSALIALDGRVVYRKAFGKADIEGDVDNTPETRHGIGSLSKAFTAAIILQMVDEGRLDLQTPVSAYLPSLGPEYAERVTLHHLLTRLSGRRIDSDTRYSVVAAVIEQQEGKPFGTVLRERILDPLDMPDTGLVSNGPDPAGRSTSYNRLSWGDIERTPQADESFATGAGGMYSTVDDLYRWNRALDGRTLLSPTSRTRMFTPGEGTEGYGWRVAAFTPDGGTERPLVYSYSGVRGPASVTLRLAEDGHLVILLGNIRQVPLADLATNLAKVLVGAPVTPAPPPLKPLYDLLVAQGVEAAVNRFAGKPDLPPELEINRLGYELMNRGRLDTALRVFQFNVEAYPHAWNTYDSLAEAYMNAGDYLTAVRYYNLSLDLNPGNSNGTMMLQRLEAHPGPF